MSEINVETSISTNPSATKAKQPVAYIDTSMEKNILTIFSFIVTSAKKRQIHNSLKRTFGT